MPNAVLSEQVRPSHCLDGVYILLREAVSKQGSAGVCSEQEPEEMAPLFLTHPTGIWVHCDKGHKTCSLPVNKYPTHVLLHLQVAAQRDQWDRAPYWKKSHSV